VKILDIEIEKKKYRIRMLQVVWQKRIFHFEVMRKKETIRASFPIAPHTAKLLL